MLIKLQSINLVRKIDKKNYSHSIWLKNFPFHYIRQESKAMIMSTKLVNQHHPDFQINYKK